MSERKVLNKYYPPDFDPNKIPRLKRPKNRQFNIRIMAPFNMRCSNCGEYVYKGKKFNSRQEKVEDEDYLGLMIFRFYIKCPRCVSEISFKTDPQNCDYSLEAGATRNFEALRTAERLAEQELKDKEEDEKNNPMKVLENRTKASQQEMEMLETLEELREMNSRHAKVDHEEILVLHKAYEEQLKKLQDDEDEEFVRSIFGKSNDGESIKRIHEDDEDDDEDSLASASSTPKVPRLVKASDILTEGTSSSSNTARGFHENLQTTKPVVKKEAAAWQKSIGSLGSKKSLLGLVKKTQSAKSVTETTKKKPEKETDNDSIAVKSVNIASDVPVPVTHSNAINTCTSINSKPEPAAKKTGLALLGAYSDSDSDESNG